MRRLLPWGLALLLSGCIPQEPRPVPPKPFQFRRLDLSQNDARGRRLWELQSPRAQYSLDQRQATVEGPRGRLFRQGAPAYAISARQGVVIKDGQQVQLNGDVSLRTLDGRQVLIRAQQAVWRPAAHTIDLTGEPVAEEGRQRLTAASARFHTADERLELTGQPRLRIWDQAPLGRGPASVDVAIQNGAWNTASGRLTAAGPVNGLQRRGQGLRPLPAPAYGAALAAGIRRQEPGRMLDAFLVAGLIEARSHERMALLAAHSPDPEIQALYAALLASEARHFGLY